MSTTGECSKYSKIVPSHEYQNTATNKDRLHALLTSSKTTRIQKRACSLQALLTLISSAFEGFDFMRGDAPSADSCIPK